MVKLAYSSATRLAAALRAGEVSSRELLDLYLRRVEEANPAVNAVVTLDVERARGLAAAADDALARGEPVGPLHGLPITIKDTIETEGLRTTAGAPWLAGHVPSQDATAVSRLKAAGAIVFGKTNCPMLGGMPRVRTPCSVRPTTRGRPTAHRAGPRAGPCGARGRAHLAGTR